jgi:transposase
MYSVAKPVGALLEIRVSSPLTMDDTMACFKQIYKTMPRGVMSRVIVDARGLRIVDPAVVDAIIVMMRQDNPWVERNAFLMPESALIGIQSERMLKELGTSNRRSFHERTAAEEWLGEVCSIEERARLARFLDEPT